jgi:predicted lipoprotein with Yx(FWY)xxD motif
MRKLRGPIGLAAGVVLLAACGGSSSSGGGKQQVNTGGAASGTSAKLMTHQGPDGAYLTDASGRTVYMFAADSNGTSKCTGACTSEWPPLTTAGAPAAGSGVQTADLATSSRSGGDKQVTYAGHPLYYFSGDSAAGDMKGQGLDDFGGKWSALTPAGKAVTTAKPASSPSSSSSSGSSAWG